MTIEIDVPDRFNAADFFLDRHLREGRGGRTAFRSRGRTLTYAELAVRASRFGNALRARGLEIEQLREHVRHRLPGYKAPRRVDIVTDLPRTSTGKIQRFRLRAGA